MERLHRMNIRTFLVAKPAGCISNGRMKSRLFSVLALAFSTQLILADDATNAPVRIGAAEAAQHYGQWLTVTGTVAQVTLRPSIVFINLDQPFPDSPLAAIIHSSATNQFGDLKSLQGKAVELNGTVKPYKNKPEIVLEKADQLRVDGKPYASTNSPVETVVPASPAPSSTPKTPAATNDLKEIM